MMRTVFAECLHPPSCTLFCLGVQFLKIPVIIVPNVETGINHCVPLRCDIVLPQQKVLKIDHVRSTCVLVGLKDVQRFSVHLLLVSFGHCRPLAASHVTGRKDMEVPHKFTQH